MYLLSILKQHFKDKFDWVAVVSVLLFTSVFVVLQYKFALISTVIKTYPHLMRVPLYGLLYAVVFSGAIAILYWRKQVPFLFNNKSFLLLSLFLIGVVSFDQSYYLLSLVKETTFAHEPVKEAVVSLATYLVSFITVFVPAGLLYVYLKPESFFGLSFGNTTKVKSYFGLLFIALLLVTLSTWSSGISSYYPVFQRSGLYHNAAQLNLPGWMAIGLFETAYASNFITVELLFRGLFVFTLSKYLGKHAILPMAACYMVFHFGKPLVETISSFFGGYLLGVFAFYTRNTWGGIILHIGTALFMEMIASLL